MIAIKFINKTKNVVMDDSVIAAKPFQSDDKRSWD